MSAESAPDAAANLAQALRYAQDLARLEGSPRGFSQRLEQADGTRRKILVVDDEPAIRMLMQATLASGDYDLHEAETGSEALALARAERPDLVLLDMRLPDLSGLEVCARLKADPVLCNIPVVMLTGESSDRERNAGLAAGAASYMTKPFSPLRLIAVIRQLLG